MERRNTLLLTVIAIATLLVAVVGATFAYLANDIGQTTDNGEVKIEKGSAKFFANGSAMAMHITSDEMKATQKGENYRTSQGSLNISYNSAGTRETSCTYDVMFKWTSTDKYVAHSKYMENNTAVENTGKEFTLTVSSVVDKTTGSGITGTQLIDEIANSENHEIDYSLLKGCDTQAGCKIGSGVVYSNLPNTEDATSVTWTFKTTMYQLEHDQADSVYGIANKNYTGEFFVDNVACY